MNLINYKPNCSKPGVYCIKNLINNKVYIGSSKRAVGGRIRRHLRSLKNNIHYNEHLQFSYNKYGEDNFEISVLVTCLSEEAPKLEAFYIKEFNSNNKSFGYNIASVEDYKFDYTLSEEHKKESSIRKKQKAKEKNGLIDDEKGLNKPINVYSLSGLFIEKAESAKYLHEKYGWNRSNVSKTLNKRKLFCKNYIIIFENDILSENDIIEVNKHFSKKKVRIEDLNKNILCIKDSAKEAAEYINCKEAEIRMCCTGKRSRIKKYITYYE